MDALHTICQPIFSTREHAHLFRAQNAQSVKFGVKTTVSSLHTHTTSGQLKYINGPHTKSAVTRPILEVTNGFYVKKRV